MSVWIFCCYWDHKNQTAHVDETGHLYFLSLKSQIKGEKKQEKKEETIGRAFREESCFTMDTYAVGI